MAELVRLGSIIDNRYEVLSHLGSGGFGMVYKARQLTTGQLVAIKIVRTFDDDDSSTGVTARFKREMEVVAELSHPNIVRLIDTGQLPDKRLYAVLQLVRGVSLSELLKREGPMDPSEAKHLMMQVLDALWSAHDLGVIHRDLKPANIMVTNVGARRNALVLDFGIATVTKPMRDHSYQSLTPAGSVGGTPAYMAPEQLHGKEPNPQTDIYSWGLVFLECLTGERVVRGSNVAEIMFTHVRPEPHPLPPTVAAHPLGQILRSAVAKDPADRYVDGRVALSQLQDCDVLSLRRLPPPKPLASEDGDTAMLPTADPITGTSNLKNTGTGSVFPRTKGSTVDSQGLRRPEATPSPQATHTVVAERRQLTAMVCEIGPMAALSEILDSDELYNILDVFRRSASSVVRGLDGVADHWEGGRMTAYFGYPVAHEDDASRALQAALGITGGVGELELDLPKELPPLAVQVGIHTGLVVTSNIHLGKSGEVPIVGDVGRIAVRLQESADPGSIFLSEDVYRLVRDRFECVPEGGRHLGGKKNKMVYRALGVAESSSMSSGAEQSPSIGRESELATLMDRWEEAIEGRGQVLLVTGEAGIGKSHLISAFRQKLHQTPYHWLECASSPYLRGSALHPITHSLSLLFGFHRDEMIATRRKKVRAFLDAHNLERKRFEGFLFALLELGEPKEGPAVGGVFKQPAEEQLLDFVFALADVKPVVMWMEDLHWTDPSTLEFVQLLVDQAPFGAVYVIATSRPSYIPSWRTRSHVTAMPLARLSRKRAEAMIRAVAGRKALPVNLVHTLAEKTDGVPLFVEELTKAVLESDALTEHEDRYELTGDVGSLAIPMTLRGSLMARLDRLGPVKEIAQIAAVVGREFNFPLLESICEVSPGDLIHALNQLVQSELVIQRGRPPQAKYIFKHALVQDTAYESLLDKTRRRYHARIADVLQAEFAEIASSQPELLAHHYTEAKEDEKAVQYWLRAGTRANERSAHVESIQHLHKGLELVAKLPESRDRDKLELVLSMSLGAPIMSTRGYGASELEETFSRALEICRKLGDVAEHVPIMWGLWVFYQVRATYANALELGEQLCRLAERSGDNELALSAYQALGSSLLLTGEYERAREYFEQGLSIYDPEKHGHMAFIYGQDAGMYCHVFMAWALFAQGYPDRAAQSAEVGVELAQNVNHPNSIAFAMCMSMAVFAQRGDYERVRSLSAQAVEVCSEYRLVHWLAFARFMGGLAQAVLDDPHQGIALMHSALGDWRFTGARIILPYFHSLLAEQLGQQGNIDEGLEVQAQVPAANYDGREMFFEPFWKQTRSRLLKKRGHDGDLDSAEALLNEAIDSARSRNDRMAELSALIDLIELLRQRGAAYDMALARLSDVVQSTQEGDNIPLLKHAREMLVQP